MNRQKHKLSRRILAVLLMAAMLITMLPSAMFAAPSGGNSGGNDHGTIVTAQNPVSTSDEGVVNVFKKEAVERTADDTWNIEMTVQPDRAIESVPMDIVLVLDKSNSMSWGIKGQHSGGPSRMSIVQDAAKNLVKDLADIGNINVGVVSFWDSSSVEQSIVSLTESYWGKTGEDRVLAAIDDLKANGSGTNLSAGLDKASTALKDRPSTNKKVVILLSDGEDNSWRNPVNKAESMANNDVTIYTIGFADQSGADTLNDIAEVANGKFYAAGNEAELTDAFTKISNEIVAMVTDNVGDEVRINKESMKATVDSVENNNIRTTNSGFRWNPDSEEGLPANSTLNIRYSVSLADSVTPSSLWNNSAQAVVTLNEDAALTYKYYEGNKERFGELELDPLAVTVDLAKLTVANEIDGEETPVKNSDQYIFVYNGNSFTWTKPADDLNGATYTGSTIEFVGSEEVVVTDQTSYEPSVKGEYKLVHHYTTGLNGTDVTIRVIVDGNDNPVEDPLNYVDIDRNTGDSDHGQWEYLGLKDGILTYDFDYENDGFDCVDIDVSLTDAMAKQYVLQGVVYNESLGSGNPTQVTSNGDGSYKIDNLVGDGDAEADCTIYLSTKYSADYYLNETLLGDKYDDSTAYILAANRGVTNSVLDEPTASKPTKEISWMNTGAYATEITLKELPTVPDSTVTGWNLGSQTGATVYDPSKVEKVSVDEVFDKLTNLTGTVIPFYATSTENPKDLDGITKEVVTKNDVESLPDSIKADDYDIPDDNKTMTFNEGGKESVTLLYKITVTGDPGTKFTVNDPGAKFVVPESGSGEIPENGPATLYVSKTFELQVGDNEFTNSASVTNNDGGEEPKEPAKDTVDVEVIPNEPDFPKLLGDGAVEVKCVNDESDHYSEVGKFGLITNGWKSEKVDNYTYTVEIIAGPYIEQYDTTVEKDGHTLSQMKNDTITFKYEEGGWKISGAPVVIEVKCESPKDITDFTKQALTQDEITKLGIEGTYDNPQQDGDKVIVEKNGVATLVYAITVKGDPGATFTVSDDGATLVKAVAGLEVGQASPFENITIPENGDSVVLYVAKTFKDINTDTLTNTATITNDKGDVPDDGKVTEDVPVEVIPTPDFEKLVKDAVQVDCITEEVDHGSKDPATYDLIKDAYTVTGSGAHYEISISADQANYYIAQYNKDVEPDHVYDNMPNGNTIILNYKGNGEWEIQKTPIVIAVRCAAPDDVTAFDKNVITSNDVDNLPDDVKSRTDYVVPAYNNGKIETVTVPKNGTITLLYVIKVEGSAGTTFTVSDPGANLVYSAYDVTEGDNDTFTGTISKDGSATFYVTRTFTSDEVGAEAEGMLRNSASITVDDGTVKEDEKDEDEDVPAEVGPETDVVKVTPADVTIYEGGKGGYNGVGDASGNIASEEDSSSLPHPMFYIYTPDGVNADGLTFSNGEKTWTAVYDGKDAEGNPLYHFTEGEGQDPVRVTYTYVDQTTGKETTVLADDLDELDNVTDVYTYLRIDLYAGDNNLETVKANVNGVGYAIDTASGRLTVRAVEADDPNTVTSDIQETAPTEDLGTAVAVEPENTTYTFNDTEVVLPADSQPSLLFDNIINDDVDRTSALEDKADEKLNANDGDYNYEIMYLDLVDANNGNAWIKSSEGTDIYWDYPEGTDKNTDFEVLHFTGLHRDGEESGFDINDLNTITMDEIENVTIEKTDDYIVFHVKEANFSPYALAWEDESGQDWPPYYPWHPDGDDDGPSGLNTEDHFSYVVGYAEDYCTGEATDNEDLWPVKPNNQITRAEVATIFYRLLEDEVRDEYDTTTNDFSDVTADSWYNQTVSTLARMGIVKGYEDGSFRPNAPITRAEFGAIATRFFAETGATYEPGTFTDVTGDEWFANAIQDAVNLGLIGGYPDGTVRPNNNITRAEACAIVNRTLGRVPDADHLLPEDVMKVWPDNNPTDWFYADMQEATNGHEYAWIEEDGHEIEEWTNLLDKDWTDR